MNIFISWSQDSLKYAKLIKDFLEKLLIKNENVKIFESNEMQSGKPWNTEIIENIKKSEFSIILYSYNNLNNPWIIFESGACLILQNDKKFDVYPFFVGTSIDELKEINKKHPINEYQIKELNWGNFVTMVKRISKKLGNEPDDEFFAFWREKFIDSLNSLNDESFASSIIKKFNLRYNNNNQRYGIISAIDEDTFSNLRKDMIIQAKKEVTLVGSSLTEAFDSPDSNPRSIRNIIKSRLCDPDGIEHLELFISDPSMFDIEDSESDSVETPIKRIDTTISAIIEMLPYIPDNKRIDIYFIPLLQIDHLVFCNDLLIVRSTMMWTESGDYKGTRLLCQATDDKDSMYSSYKRYIETLKHNSIVIHKENYNNVFSESNSKARKKQMEWRKRLFNNDRERNIIGLHKLYRYQLMSYLFDTWDSRFATYSIESHWRDSKESFISSNQIKSREDLFQSENLLDDPTQRRLLPYLKETELLMNQVIKKYDSNGYVQLFPSLDLGVPNNIQRLAGGFATGMLVVWKCGTPIIPIDTTVNVCSSSVFKLSGNISDTITEQRLRDIMVDASKEGYTGGFSDGNHFIMVCKSVSHNNYYLIMHSSAKEFKYSYLGLYPHEKNWYADKIKVYYSEDGKRYLRYLKDKDAIDFIQLAKKLEKHNVDIHEWFAERLCRGVCEILSEKKDRTLHHYYMPTDSSVAIGTFIADPGQQVPIFTNAGYPIYLFQVVKSGGWRVRLGNNEKYMVPHGWGQEFVNVGNLEADYDNKTLYVNNKGFPIKPKSRLETNVDIRIREFDKTRDGEDFFERGKKFLNGQPVEKLIPLITFSREGIVKYE